MGHFVKEGKSITSKRGILGEHEEVKAADLAGGEDSLKALAKNHLYKASKAKTPEVEKAAEAEKPEAEKQEEKPAEAEKQEEKTSK